jgi:hypothetical protein
MNAAAWSFLIFTYKAVLHTKMNVFACKVYSMKMLLQMAHSMTQYTDSTKAFFTLRA